MSLHVKPSPEYPLLHMQLSKFALFEHVAFPLQGPESHTSISLQNVPFPVYPGTHWHVVLSTQVANALHVSVQF